MNMTFGYTSKHVLLSWSITSAIPVILNSPRQRWAGFFPVGCFPENTVSAENWVGLFITKETAQ